MSSSPNGRSVLEALVILFQRVLDHDKEDYYEKVILMRMNENVIAEAAGIDCQHCAYFGCTHEYIVPNFRT